jgi:hypothetical protein
MERTSDDGRVIGGALSFGPMPGHGLVRRQALPPARLPARPRRCRRVRQVVNTGFVNDVSPDGRILVGYGAGPRTFQGYMVVLPPMDAK